MSDYINTAADIKQAIQGKTMTDVHVHSDEEGGISWIGLTLDDGSEIELSAHGYHTEGWLIVERGRRIRDIYKVSA